MEGLRKRCKIGEEEPQGSFILWCPYKAVVVDVFAQVFCFVTLSRGFDKSGASVVCDTENADHGNDGEV